MCLFAISATLCLYAACSCVWYEISKCRGALKTERLARNSERLAFAGRMLCILSALFAFGSSLVHALNILIQKDSMIALHNQTSCVALYRLQSWLTAASTTTVYAFLWVRQRVFYIDPLLRRLNNTAIAYLSFIVLGLWVVYFLGISVIHLGVLDRVILTNGACIVPLSSRVITYYSLTSWIGCCLFMQLFLLMLFVYPLLRSACFNARGFQFSKNKLDRNFRKATIMSVVCIVSDVISFVTTFTLSGHKVTLYTINLTINAYSIIFCFDYWKKLLCPFCLLEYKSTTTHRAACQSQNTQSITNI